MRSSSPQQSWSLSRGSWAAPVFLAAPYGCTGDLGDLSGGAGGAGSPSGTGGAAVDGTGGSTTGGTGSTTGGTGSTSGTGSVSGTGSGNGSGGIVGGGGTGGGGPPGTGGIIVSSRCMDRAVVKPGRAPLRRLTIFEYNNTVRDLLGDTTQPGQAFPSDPVGNGFGNDAEAISSSETLVNGYSSVGEAIALRATATPAQLAKLAPCGMTVTTATEESCARTIIEGLLPKAFRRAPAAGEVDDLLTTVYRPARAASNFATGVATVIEAVLQSPDFLYRVEMGVADPARPGVRRPTGDEMATRLSYFFWGTMPDDTLRAAARSGELLTNAGVRAQAVRMRDLLASSRPSIRYFFDSLLPISGLSSLERDKVAYPSFSAAIGAAMREETQRFLENEIFLGTGTWASVLTADYTFLNQPLATFYGIGGVTGADYRKVPLDTTKRLGLLTQGGLMAGLTHANYTNPVVRGSFVVQKMMCRTIPTPTGAIAEMVFPPDPYSAPTARQRYSAHSMQAVCATCHKFMDPVGFSFENYDAVGLYRTQENGQDINVSGGVPGLDGTLAPATNGPVELVRALAQTPEVHGCFATSWTNYAYGLTLRTTDQDDVCTKELITEAFRASNYNIKQLLVDLTQTDAFLYLPAR